MVFASKVWCIATCSCGASFYSSPGGWQRMLDHINENNKEVHRWTFVSDMVISRSVGERDDYISEMFDGE